MEEKQKPFILEMDEAKTEIIQVINKAIQVRKLPCYLIDMLMSEIGASIKEGAKQELAMAKAQMENEEVA
jgi:hypothetical protein